MKAISVKTNKNGVKYALVGEGGETFRVIVERENYAPHCKGGMSKAWLLVEYGMTKDAAEKLFNRRSA